MSHVAVAALTRAEVLDVLGTYGRCREYPTSWWFPVGPGPDSAGVDFVEVKAHERKAKRICASCPMNKLCLAYALLNRETFGIWGGYSERQRRTMRRGQNEVYLSAVSVTVVIEHEP